MGRKGFRLQCGAEKSQPASWGTPAWRLFIEESHRVCSGRGCLGSTGLQPQAVSRGIQSSLDFLQREGSCEWHTPWVEVMPQNPLILIRPYRDF